MIHSLSHFCTELHYNHFYEIIVLKHERSQDVLNKYENILMFHENHFQFLC